MKIRPVILCGGAGTRLWPDTKKHQAKQFIDFGGWTLFGKTLERIKNPLFDYPIISTNLKYLKDIKKNLKIKGINKYKITLEPVKKNTAPAILISALIKEIPEKQPIIFLSSDHLIENNDKLNSVIKKHKKFLNKTSIPKLLEIFSITWFKILRLTVGSFVKSLKSLLLEINFNKA